MVAGIKRWFDIEELVCRHVYNRFGERAWSFFDDKLLETMLYIREGIGRPIWVNNWSVGGQLTQRGLRCNVCALVAEKTRLEKVYVSSHLQGTGVDFDVQGMTAAQVRRWIVEHEDGLPYPIRIEDGVGWVHLDMRNDGERDRIVFFKG